MYVILSIKNLTKRKCYTLAVYRTDYVKRSTSVELL